MKKIWGAIVVFVFVFTVFNISGKGVHTDAHFFVPLAQGFIKGHLYVDKMEFSLHEMIPQEEVISKIYKELVDGSFGKYYVIYPPLPAVMVLPVVAIWGEATNQSTISQIIAALSVAISFLVFLKLGLDLNKSLWTSALYGFGSMLWYHAVIGSSWYFALICAMFFLWLAILATLYKRNLFLIGLLLGLAFLCRFPVILSIPFFLYLTKDRYIKSGAINYKAISLFFAAIAICVGLLLSYNYARYHRLDNYGYTLLEKRPYNINNEYKDGSYSISYINRNLKAMFWSFPNKVDGFPFFSPNIISMALWIVMPAIIIIFLAPLKDPVTKASVLAILFTLPACLFHGGIGASQFGYRYALDFMPFIMLLIALAIKEAFYIWEKFLIVLSIVVNFWGIWFAFLK